MRGRRRWQGSEHNSTAPGNVPPDVQRLHLPSSEVLMRSKCLLGTSSTLTRQAGDRESRNRTPAHRWRRKVSGGSDALLRASLGSHSLVQEVLLGKREVGEEPEQPQIASSSIAPVGRMSLSAGSLKGRTFLRVTLSRHSCQTPGQLISSLDFCC